MVGLASSMLFDAQDPFNPMDNSEMVAQMATISNTSGIAEISLGLIALFVVNYGLLFWALGFGILHIVYGAYMYLKYEK